MTSNIINVERSYFPAQKLDVDDSMFIENPDRDVSFFTCACERLNDFDLSRVGNTIQGEVLKHFTNKETYGLTLETIKNNVTYRYQTDKHGHRTVYNFILIMPAFIGEVQVGPVKIAGSLFQDDREHNPYVHVDYINCVGPFILVNNIRQEMLHLMTFPPVEREEGVYTINVEEFFRLERSDNEFESNTHKLDTKQFEDIKGDLYPYIDFDTFLRNFANSDEKIAIIRGEPGTGKTSLMKLIIRDYAKLVQRNIKAIYVKDSRVLHNEAFWTLLNNRGDEFLILDDLDNELVPRESVESESEKEEDPNKKSIVNKLLSFSDGIFPTNMKILITTNLRDTGIDQAIVRPGRCFDILDFPGLNYHESLDIWVDVYGLSRDSFEETLGYLYDNVNSQRRILSQASVTAEAEEIIRNQGKSSYLKEDGISKRNLLIQDDQDS